MPRLFRLGSYIIYFWAHESLPLEPIHIHIAEGKPQEDATKVWITQTGRCIKANNRSKVPENILRHIMKMVEANSENIQKERLEKTVISANRISKRNRGGIVRGSFCL